VTKLDVQQGSPALTILKTLDSMGPLHGYGVARRIEETSRGKLTVRYGTLYPSLLKLEMEGFVRSKWGLSDHNRRAKFYSLTPAGKKQLAREQHEWRETNLVLSWFLAPGTEGA
jgi:PadR family transcriptional regulator, regulatory protein PadR